MVDRQLFWGVCVIIVLILISSGEEVQAQERADTLDSNTDLSTEQSLKVFLRNIEKKFDVTILYRQELLDKTVTPENMISIDDYKQFDNSLKQQFLTYGLQLKQLDNTTYVLLEATPKNIEDYNFTVSGSVTDANSGIALSDVNIQVKTGTGGTFSDTDGSFKLEVSAKDDTLTFSFVGYDDKVVPLQGSRKLDIKMEPDRFLGKGLVVIGYGRQKRGEITGAITSLNSDQISSEPVTDFEESIQGKTAGVQVTQNSGSPGKSAKIWVRGLTSINNPDPLYVVDGNPLTANEVNIINPNDIASAQILKDASSQAIYGSRGANGVILIETKRGSRHESDLSFNFYQGVQQVPNKLDLLSSSEFVRLNTEAYHNAGLPSPWGDPSQYRRNTDWQDALFRTAPIQNFDMALSGGNEDVIYRLSGEYFSQDGIIIGSGYERMSARLNSTYNPTNNVEVGENLLVARSSQYLVGEGGSSRVNILSALKMDPTVPVKYEGGNYADPRFSDVINPIADINYNYKNNPIKNWSLLGGGYIRYEPVDEISLKTNLSVDLNFGDVKSFIPRYNVSPNQNNPVPRVSHTKSLGYSWTWDNTLTYEKEWEESSFTVLGGVSMERFKYEFISGSNQGQPGNDEYLRYLDAGISNPIVGGRETTWALLSFIGRINYDYHNKYFFTATLRRDGSSKFAANNKFGNFPSTSIGWVITEEPFFRSSDKINYLKLRGSWGIVGNQAGAGYYDFSSNILNNYYVFGESPSAVVTSQPNGFGNPNLKWERVRQWNIGFDYELFNSTLAGSFDYYYKKTNDMLLRIPILSTSGYETGPLTNVASMLNSGIEFSANYNRSLFSDFSLDVGLNFATLRNEVLSLENQGAQIYDSPNMTRAGHSAAAFYGYVFEGIFQNQLEIDGHATQPGAEPGDIRFQDFNNDGVITDDDQTFLGSPIPKIAYGFHIGGSYKSFDLDLSFSGVYGNKIYQAYKYETNGFFISNYNMEKETLDRWQGEGTSNIIPRLNANDPNNNARPSSYYLADGSYLRLQNATLGFNLPESSLKRLSIEGVRLYLSAQNLLTFTKYDGYDPEVGIRFGGNAGTLNLGVDAGNYPQPRTITAGINIRL